MAEPATPPGMIQAFAIELRPNGRMIEAYLTAGKDLPIERLKAEGIPDEILLASISAAVLNMDAGLVDRFKALVKDCGTVIGLDMSGGLPPVLVEGTRGG